MAKPEKAMSGDVIPFHSDAKRLKDLRDLASKNLARAHDEAWVWLSEFQSLSEHGHLLWLFSEGTAPESPEGDCEGMVLGLYGAWWLSLVDIMVRAGRVLGGVGWTGKSFDPETSTGHNRLTRSSRLPMRLRLPFYRFQRAGDELLGFRFDHKVESSPLLPAQEVRSIVYANPRHKNPKVLVGTRDEIVEIIPKVYLGRVLLAGRNRWRLVGFFALRQPIGEGS